MVMASAARMVAGIVGPVGRAWRPWGRRVVTALGVGPVMLRGTRRSSSGVSWGSVGRMELTARSGPVVRMLLRAWLRGTSLALPGVDGGRGVDLSRGRVRLRGRMS